MKKIIHMCILILLVLSLSACTDTETIEVSNKKEIRFPIYDYTNSTNEASIIKALNTNEKMLVNRINSFNANNPNIKVIIDYVSPNAQISAEGKPYKHENKDGVPIDIVRFEINGLDFDKTVNETPELLLDLSTHYETSSADIPDNIVQSGMRDGQLLMIPSGIYPGGISYNQTIFDEMNLSVPETDWTLEQFKELARVMTQTSAYMGTDLRTFDPITLLQLLLNSSGSDVLSPDKQTAVGYLDSEEAIHAIQWMRAYKEMEKSLNPSDGYMFNNGNVGMQIGSMMSQSTNAKSFKVGVAPIPPLTYSIRTNPSYVEGFGISSSSINQQQAWEFIEYLILSVNQDSLAYAAKYVPASSAIATEIRKTADERIRFYFDEASVAVSYGWYTFSKAWNEDLKAQLDDIMASNDSEIAEKMSKLAQAVDRQLEINRHKEP